MRDVVMKESGIVRKLDNLGRLVIPKEIRRCMRIKEGSSIEFGLLPSGEIVLCKYSLVNQISDYADDFCEVLGEVCDSTVLIGDRDRVISGYGVNKRSVIGARWSDEVLDIIDSKNCYLAQVSNETTIVPIIEEDKFTYTSQIIMPIIIQGEIEGVIALCCCKGEVCLGSEHLMVLKLVSKFLSKQME
ncbi:MAG: hypothetical protein E7354_00040 [Clostridiales bacterium]|nr:hypothetical protein [Clostridiales bacterium]